MKKFMTDIIRRYSLLLAFLLPVMAPGSLRAQDVCTVIAIKNPHGVAMEIRKLWVVDSVNFSVATLQPLPFQLGATESFDVEVCILARDGQSHSSQIRYTNTHGTSSYSISMTAPGAAAVQAAMSGAAAKSGFSIVPNPASGNASIEFDGAGMRDVVARLVAMDGSAAMTIPISDVAGGRIPLDLSGLAAGRYLIVIDAGGVRAATGAVVVMP